MVDKVKIDNKEYDVKKFTDTSRNLYNQLRNLDLIMVEKKNLLQLFQRAKKAYIADLKVELLSEKAGFDFSE